MANAGQLRQQLAEQMKSSMQGCMLDFNGVRQVDSSALALCLAGMRLAVVHGKHFTVGPLPEQLVAMAGLFGLDVTGWQHH